MTEKNKEGSGGFFKSMGHVLEGAGFIKMEEDKSSDQGKQETVASGQAANNHPVQAATTPVSTVSTATVSACDEDCQSFREEFAKILNAGKGGVYFGFIELLRSFESIQGMAESARFEAAAKAQKINKKAFATAVEGMLKALEAEKVKAEAAVNQNGKETIEAQQNELVLLDQQIKELKESLETTQARRDEVGRNAEEGAKKLEKLIASLTGAYEGLKTEISDNNQKVQLHCK